MSIDNERGEQQQVMDAEAVRARRELEPNLQTWSARDLMDWWNRWYQKAGHKRLGRVLVEISNKKAASRE